MTAKNYKKMLKQLNKKPAKKIKYLKHNKPKTRSCGEALRRCKFCGRRGAHIRKYSLGICRQCFRESAKDLGFKKYS
jgi:ribosomal protein S14